MNENTRYILAIEFLAAAQGISLRRPLKSSNTIENAIKSLRDHVPEWTEDRIMSPDIELANSLIHQGTLAELLPAQPLDTILY
jgi:histidine ammonia-lyase